MKQARIFSMTIFLLVASIASNSAAAPQVTVSIRPLYFLTASIMRSVGTPQLILADSRSPHHYHLQPSQLRRLRNADIVFWIGPPMESTLEKMIRNLPGKVHAYQLINTTGLQTLEFSGTTHRHETKHESAHSRQDPHIWLAPDNAKQIATAIAEKLMSHDPENTAIYQNNLTQLIREIEALKKSGVDSLAPLKHTKIIALHNAWQYFATSFGLEGYSAINTDGLEHLGSKSFLRLKQDIKQGIYACVITGPETSQKKSQELLSGSDAIQVVLDPIANDLDINSSYTDFVRHIMKELSVCHRSN